MSTYNVTATIITGDGPPTHPDHRTFGPFKDCREAERTITALASRENVIAAKLWKTDPFEADSSESPSARRARGLEPVRPARATRAAP